MSDNSSQGIEKTNNIEATKKRSFFGGSLDANSKDFLDFRYNTQEEIDKLNEEMTTTDDLDNIIKQTNNMGNNNLEDKKNNEEISDNNKAQKNDGPIEGEIVENINNERANIDNSNDIENKFHDNENDINDNSKNEENENSGKEEELGNNAKFFDPFELDFDNERENNEGKDKETLKGNEEMFDPFRLNEEENDEQIEEEVDEQGNEQIEEEVDEQDNEQVEEEVDEQDNEQVEEEVDEQDNEQVEEKVDEQDNEQVEEEVDEQDNEQVEEEVDEQDNEQVEEEVDEQDNEQVEEKVDEQDNEQVEEEVDEQDNEQVEEEVDEQVKNKSKTKKEISAIGHINTDKKEDTETNKKYKKYSTKGKELTNEEIQLEQGQDVPNSKNDDEYKPSAEELFEREPEFFANDELSQQFMQLVRNVRSIFKLERKDGEQDPYFKILGGKTNNSTLEYLFYLIEEENEPIDLYIKKVETDQESEKENEHLVQFSYNENKELNIFVDEIILYEKVNKSDSTNIEYNDTKAILEKFIFLTENHYNKLKAELDKQREEKQKKRQLQQIFKGF